MHRPILRVWEVKRSVVSIARSLLLSILGLSLSRPALAQEWTGGVGAFVGIAFGRRQEVAWGFETFAMFPLEGRFYRCRKHREAAGPLLQLAFIGTSEPRLTLALQGGRLIWKDDVTAVTGEVGVTRRFGSEPGWGLQVGITPEWLMFNASFREQLFLGDGSLTTGVRILPTYDQMFEPCIYD
jgi:hypothetical protein